MIGRGVLIATVAETLGHADTARALSVYAHVVQRTQVAAARTMDGVLVDAVLKGVSGER
jgi:hypothetical protein